MPAHKDPQYLLPYRPVASSELEDARRGASTALPYLLAVKFNFDVKQGGFAQLLYNLQGELLAEVEDMLIAANAAVAQDYYVRAVTTCLDNKDEYFRFLSSNYADANEVKHTLQLLSVEYLQQRIDFINEAAGFLATCSKP